MEREDEIRLIAYSIWEGDGCSDGHDLEHWIKAEAIWIERNAPKSSTVKEEEAPHAVRAKSKKGRRNPKQTRNN